LALSSPDVCSTISDAFADAARSNVVAAAMK
jgi:hypothetical protein